MSQQLKAWPSRWPLYKQGCFASFDDSCDMLVGPCACGAWHQEGEFKLHRGMLYRHGRMVNPSNVLRKPTTVSKSDSVSM